MSEEVQSAAPAATSEVAAPEATQQDMSLLAGAQAPDGDAASAAEAVKDSAQQEAPGGPEQKAEQEKPEEKKAPEGAPEKYEDFKAPEGVELNSGLTEEFKGLAKELNLTQAQAQSVIDRMMPKMAQRQTEYVQEVSRGWADRCRKDPEVGGERFSEALSHAARLRDRFGYGSDGKMDPDIAEFLGSPMGNHPGALKLLARAGAAFGEAKFPQGSPTGKQPTAEDFYAAALRK